MFLDLRRVVQGDKGQVMKHGPASALGGIHNS